MPRAANFPQITMIKYIKNKINGTPVVGVVLGSGLQGLANSLENAVRVSYANIPSFIETTIEGHVGEFVCGTLRGTSLRVIFANGRFHYYEGLKYSQLHIIVDIFNQLGCEHVITTNSSGCLVPAWSPGDIMIIDSHIDMTFRDGPDAINKKLGK